MKPSLFTSLLMLLLVNSIHSYAQDIPILPRWREEAIVKDLLLGDAYKLLSDSLKADTADYRKIIREQKQIHNQLHSILDKKDSITYDLVEINTLEKNKTTKLKKKVLVWGGVAVLELIYIIFHR